MSKSQAKRIREAALKDPVQLQKKKSCPFKRVLNRISKDASGQTRTIVPLAAMIAAYALLTLGVRQLLSQVFSTLFQMWGVNSLNIEQAPAWAGWIFRYSALIVSAAVNLGIIAIFRSIRKAYLPEEQREKFIDLRFVRWTGIGAVLMLAANLLFLLTDSMRLSRPFAQAHLSKDILLYGLIYALAAYAEEIFLRGGLYALIRKKKGRALALGLVLLLSYVISMGWNYPWIGMLNLLLQSAACCLIYESFGLQACVGFRFGWSLTVNALLVNEALESFGVWELYHVSEKWFTGGNAGVLCGVCSTILFMGVILITLRYQKKHCK